MDLVLAGDPGECALNATTAGVKSSEVLRVNQ